MHPQTESNVEASPVVRLDSLRAASGRQYGGKAANLGELLSAGQAVPRGIALGKNALAHFLRENGVDLAAVERIHTLGMTFLESALAAAQELQQQILQVVRQSPFPEALQDSILTELAPWLDKNLAVRSSCVVEDSKSTSFAGQYVSVLGVQGQEAVLAAVRTCWASQYDGRALSYAIARRGMPVLSPGMAVVIQEMIDSEYAGVCFTTGPTAKTSDVAVVEAVRGCGEQLVSGAKTPYHYEVTTDGQIRNQRIPNSENRPPAQRLIQAVAAKARAVADHFGTPQDIEWATVGDEVILLQARPITVTGHQRKGTPVGLPGAAKAPESRPSQKPSTDPLLILRDDLHEWMLTACDPFIFRGASYILSNQRKDGSWRVDGHPEWDEVTTAMVVHMLVSGGIPPTQQWRFPGQDEAQNDLGIPAAIQYLARTAKPDGRWGSDLWDTCQVLRALHLCGVFLGDPMLQRPVKFIQDEISRSLASCKEQEWFGAGFLAVALRMFTEFRMPEEASKCLDLLLSCQDATGNFYGPNAAPEGSKVPSEWHTAQAISALARATDRKDRVKIAADKACKWLLSKQQVNGTWGVTYEPYRSYNTFFTAYSTIALLDAGLSGDALQKAYKCLRGQQKASGGFGDTGSSLMAMSAIQTLKGDAFTLKIPIPVFVRIQSTLSGTR
jgi:hypothetical protein